MSGRPRSWKELKNAVVDAGARRIRPLSMTTTTTVVGGMIFEFVTLFMVPLTFAFFENRKIKKGEFYG